MRLAVVGEDDERVRPRRVAVRALDPPELLVELPQRLERVLALETGMVGDLVVAREGRVDRGPAFHHVGEDAVHDQVADDDTHRRAQERVHAAAVAPRPDVAPALLRCRDQLEDHLPGEEDEATRHVEPVGEERAVARVGRAFGLHAADGEDDVIRSAGEEVAAARATTREQPRAARVSPLELGAVLGRRTGDERLPLLLDPAEGRDVVVRAEQDPRLRRARLRGEVGLPLEQLVRAVREPARHRRRVPVAHRALQHRKREPVDLEEDDSRLVGHDSVAGAAGDELDDAERVLVVVVRAEDDREGDADGGRSEREDERRQERVDLEAGGDPVGEEQHPGVDEQDREEAEQCRERKPQRRNERRQEGVQHGDERCGGERYAEARDRASRAGEARRRTTRRRRAARPARARRR